MQTKPKIRLFVDGTIAVDSPITPSKEQMHYLRRVMRLADGDDVLVFNGKDGEWRARLACESPGDGQLIPDAVSRAQEQSPDLWLGFAPVKRPHIDMIAIKATELGVSRIVPVLTRHTVVSRVNTRRLRANTTEAAEQCGRLDVPILDEPTSLDALLSRAAGRPVFWADEAGGGQMFGSVLDATGPSPALILVGPEGGFAAEERDLLRRSSKATAISLGPRILRAETAAIAMVTLWQALAGDWTRGN